MKTASRIVLVVFLLGLTAHRLPAPIHEESTPAPKPVATPKPKPKIATTPKPKPTIGPFVGTWTGTVAGTAGASTEPKSTSDQKTIQVRNDGTISGNIPPGKGTVSPDGRALTWSFQTSSLMYNCTLRIVDPRTAIFQLNSSGTFLGEQIRGNLNGTLTKY